MSSFIHGRGLTRLGMLRHGINNNLLYMFNKAMGAGIGLDEPEPEKIIDRLSATSRSMASLFNDLLRKVDFDDIALAPAVQYGSESDFYLEDEELVAAIMLEAKHEESPVLGFIHAQSDVIPTKPGFLEKMARVLRYSNKLGAKNTTVHLPLDKEDVTAATVDALVDDSFLDLVEKHHVSIDLENNWHGSWFGYHENVIDLFGRLKDTLYEKGRIGAWEYLGITFDTGHFLAQYHLAARDLHEGIYAFIDGVGDRMRTLHLHCNDGEGDQHLPFSPSHVGCMAEHQDLLLDALPALEIKKRAAESRWDTMLLSELGKPFTQQQLHDHVTLLQATFFP